LKRQAIGRKYCVGKGAITAKDRRINIVEKLEQQSKKGKGKGKVTVTITISNNNNKDVNNDND
jgi:hypothetical protein